MEMIHNMPQAKKIMLTFSLKEILNDNENEIYAENELVNLDEIHLQLDCNVGYTFKQIFLTLVYQTISRLVGIIDVETLAKRQEYYKKKTDSESTTDAFLSSHAQNLRSVNILMHKFVNRFIQMFQKNISIKVSSEKVHNNVEKTPSFIFLYTDLIQSVYFGDSMTKILYVSPHHGENIYTLSGALKPFKISKEKINDISFEFRDEFNDKIRFQDSSQPSFIELFIWGEKKN